MFLAKFLYNKFCDDPPPKDWYIQQYESILYDFNIFPSNNEEAQNTDVHVEESYMPNAEYFRYQGTVTQLFPDGSGRIDGKYMFNTAAASNMNLKTGHRVTCMARKISEDQPVVIYKIESIDHESWAPEEEDLENIKPNGLVPLRTCRKILVGEIIGKLNGQIFIDTRPKTMKVISLVISETGCAFNPTIGDQVELEVEYGMAPDDPSNDALVGYHSLKPNENKFVTAEITSFNKKQQYGLVDEKYVFYMDVLQHSNNQNFFPNKGDTVNVEVISSHQKIENDREYFYRCINLTQIRLNKADRAAATTSAAHQIEPIAESDDEFDDDGLDMTFTKNDALKVTLESSQSKKQIQLVAVNKSNQPKRISTVRTSNELIASQIECRALYEPQNVKPGGTFVYRIDVTGAIRGNYKLKINFKVDNKYFVRRCINFEVKSVNECSGPRVVHSKAYTKKIYSDKIDTVKGKAPVVTPHFVDNRLNPFPVPKKLFEDTMNANNLYELLDAEYGDMFHKLAPANYDTYFHYLLHFEEIYMRHEFRMYDQDRGHFVRDGNYLAYEMSKNIFECRPSIVIGDMIYAESLLQPTSPNAAPIQYQGYIHMIKRHRLLLKFSEDFHNSYRGEDYKLIFQFSRSKFIKQHNAIDFIGKKLKRFNSNFLFPTSVAPEKSVTSEKKLQLHVQLMSNGNMELEYPKQMVPWFNPKLNEIQKRAVVNVLRGEAKQYPYLIFGPPGTGKTSTIIEVITQLYRTGSSRILVAAPSNSAANLITRLLSECSELKEGQFVRIVGQNSLARDQIPDELRKYCVTVDIAAPRSTAAPENPIENGIRVQCNSDFLSLHRILISTCSTFGSLLQMKFKPNHFTHAIIDEAGQCIEPEIAIPISLLGKDAQIILAGDPHQLGPIVHSQISKQCGLSKSLLSRLLDFLPYRSDVGRNGGFDERLVTQLLHNYRSIPSILDAYNKLSYESKLIATITDENSDEHKLLAKVQAGISKKSKLKHVPNHGVYFIGVEGKDEQTADTTSWRNPQEYLEVITVLTHLFELGISEDSIGVITPYTLQVKEIRGLCDVWFNGKQPKIGSVEEFQGQERDIIIISTVRSRSKYLSHDGKYGLGFIQNKKRLNVAISRARSVLIIIGNPAVLVSDENWRQIIHDCYINGSYSGMKIPNAAVTE